MAVGRSADPTPDLQQAVALLREERLADADLAFATILERWPDNPMHCTSRVPCAKRRGAAPKASR
jgi:hypothetical protein